MSGTEGLGYRLEAIQIKLTGADASKFDIYYRVHAQNFGWMGWAKNGESAGTAGFGYRLEAIQIKNSWKRYSSTGINRTTICKRTQLKDKCRGHKFRQNKHHHIRWRDRSVIANRIAGRCQ